MRLVVDVQACQGPSRDRGIGYYARCLTRALAETAGQHDVIALADGSADPEDLLRLRHELSPALGREAVVAFSGAEADLGSRAVLEVSRESALAALRPDAVLVASLLELRDGAPMTVSRWTPHGPPTAGVLYDLIPMLDLDAYKADPTARAAYEAGLAEMARLDLLLSISDYSSGQAASLLPQLPPAVTIHGAAPAQGAGIPRPGLSRPGFGLAVGRDEPRKDVGTAVLAWAGIPGHVRAGQPFVVVGSWPRPRQRELQDMAAAAGLPREQLVFLGAVSDAEMAWLYRNASVLAFPSLVEGLGLPPLEAMSVGTPVLLAEASSLVELLDEPAAFFPPGDVGRLSALMAGLLEDAGQRDRLVEAGHRANRRFTWHETAGRAWRALEQLSARGDRPTAVPATAAVVGGRGPLASLAAARSSEQAFMSVDDAWAHEQVLHVVETQEHWRCLTDNLGVAPGAVLAAVMPERLEQDLDLLLAPATGVTVRSPAEATALVRLGVVSTPVSVVDAQLERLCEQLHVSHESDPATHWSRACVIDPALAAGAASFVSRPRWSVARPGPLLVSDVTVYRTTPFLSGIQRATLRLHASLAELLGDRGGAVLPTVLARGTDSPAHPSIARDPVLASPEVSVAVADWLLCLDLDDRLPAAVAEVQAARARGTGVAVNVYDLLPHTHPQWWPSGAADASFRPWVRAALEVADVLLVNSLATAHDLERFVADHRPIRVDGFDVQLMRLGADFSDAPARADEALRDQAHFLVVGTVEPRKGHGEVLDAFEALWARGHDLRLTVVGRPGWMVERLTRRMEALAVREPAFCWERSASDAELDELYRRCTAVVVASEAEGFGLPVVEAAVRGCPVVVRDIPVLRELAGDDAVYFRAPDRPLERVLAEAVASPQRLAVLTDVPVLRWSEVAARLLGVLDGEVQPVARWSPETSWSWS